MVSFLVSTLALAATLKTADASFLRSPPSGNATLTAHGSRMLGMDVSLTAPPQAGRKLSTATAVMPSRAGRKLATTDEYGFVVSHIREEEDWCLTAAYGVSDFKKLGFRKCNYEEAPATQLFKFDEFGKLHSAVDDTKCMLLNHGDALFDGVRMRLADCVLETLLNMFEIDGENLKVKLPFALSPPYCVTNRGPNPHNGDTIHAKQGCKDRGDYKWSFLTLSEVPLLLSHQETPGVCNAIPGGEIGCSNGDGSAGNPNDLVNCFTVPSTPFAVTEVKFWLHDGLASLPDTPLSVRVWAGDISSGPSGGYLVDQPLTSYSAGLNTVTLDTPLTIGQTDFCVGVYGGDENDGFRLDTEAATGDLSYVMAPNCGATSFLSLPSIGYDRVFCIEAMVVRTIIEEA